MKTIGFAGTFYTLWDVEAERVNVALGAWYDKVTCTYYQNLSKNLEDAIAKAGTDNVDESLRGKRKSFEFNKPLVIEPSVMTDRERLFRIILVNQKENTLDARKEALQRMLDLGYIIVKNGVYEIQGEVRFADIWNHSQLGIDIKGTI
jgi:hypothetical protein